MTKRHDVLMQKVRNAVKAELGGRVICARCRCTLETFSDVCTADLADECPGFIEVDRVRSAAYRRFTGAAP